MGRGPIRTACAALAVAASAALTPPAQAANANRSPPEPGCVVDVGTFDPRRADTTAERDVSSAVHTELGDRYGRGYGPEIPSLRAGLIGTVLDRHDLVVVVDPDLIDVRALQRDLRAVATRAAAGREAPSDRGIRVQAGCHPAPALHEVHRFMPNEFRLISRTSFSWSLWVATSTWRVCNDDEVANAVLKARFGDLVDVRRGCTPINVGPG